MVFETDGIERDVKQQAKYFNIQRSIQLDRPVPAKHSPSGIGGALQSDPGWCWQSGEAEERNVLNCSANEDATNGNCGHLKLLDGNGQDSIEGASSWLLLFFVESSKIPWPKVTLLIPFQSVAQQNCQSSNCTL